jgi:hypothetical protein
MGKQRKGKAHRNWVKPKVLTDARVLETAAKEDGRRVEASRRNNDSLLRLNDGEVPFLILDQSADAVRPLLRRRELLELLKGRRR